MIVALVAAGGFAAAACLWAVAELVAIFAQRPVVIRYSDGRWRSPR